ncbi:trifunctional purine biosynthetic protein adenosine-3 isoform X2 [Heptranchias perlo]|uniref:trifunctional purine biosynthetic protein adenosine-3 isoform X2 n=1 Tax=Heptranchias perlo TaxID=212740 RepID=UPI0035593A5D
MRTMAERVLIIGSGGREHALAWKLAQSPLVQQVLVAPGNAGTAESEKISNSAVSVSNHAILAQYCKDHNIGLVVVGPEGPLAAGIVDDLTAAGVRCFGPSSKATQLEASKHFAKDFMDRHDIPTARWKAFTDPGKACNFIQCADFPALVVKASGLAAGKGVIVAADKGEACEAVRDIMQEKAFGSAGETVIVEELLEGEEVSCLCFSDGVTVACMPPAQDHKRLLDGDQGPNTGGMGAYCPAPQVSKDVLQTIKENVLQKTIDGMKQEGTPYVGVLYAGLMLTRDGPKVLEFNCRFGDPECQVILPLLKSDLYEIVQATVGGKLSKVMPAWLETSSAVTVVMASGGYPGNYPKGQEITDLSLAEDLGLHVFHAGTAMKKDMVVTNGGRVLAVTAVNKDLIRAVAEANKGVETIKFQGAVCRKDIAHRAIAFVNQSSTPCRGMTYKDCGVDIAAGNGLVCSVKPFAKSTSRSGCKVKLGGFAGIFDLKEAGYSDPILVSGTDGVGTKLKVAWMCNKHDTLGQDLVAMCVNDVLTRGAEPLFFLDCFSCGKLDVDVAKTVIAGIAEACKMAGCALLGGETAEMPGMYSPGQYDLAGFAVGAVERVQMLPQREQICAGDIIIGVASSGLHSNGFSLVRAIVKKSSLQYSSPAPDSYGSQTLGEVLLTPTRIYVKALLPILRQGHVKACAHITGGGLLENIPRVLPKSLGVALDASCWKIPEIFSWLQRAGALSEEEIARTFNCGVGAVLIVDKEKADDVLRSVNSHYAAWTIGNVVQHKTGNERVVIKNLMKTLHLNLHSEQSATGNGSMQVCGQTRKMRVGVLISGTGTNLQALIEHTKDPASCAEIAIVISNKTGVEGLKKATRAGIPTRVIDHKLYGSRSEFDSTVDEVLQEFSVELVCLAGFMRILSGPFVKKWNGKLLNVHPSLLPSFKGINAHKQVLQAGVRVTGCSVHFVAEEVDAGAIIVQEVVPVKVGDTEETLSERVKKAEHVAYPAAVHLVTSGAIHLGEDGRICWKVQNCG